MKSEDQCVSLELATKLEELGFEQESIFQYTVSSFNYQFSLVDKERNKMWPRRCFEGLMTTADCKLTYSAYTVAELGEMLPKNVCYRYQTDGRTFRITFGDHNEYAETEADARAKMLIYLKENNLI